MSIRLTDSSRRFRLRLQRALASTRRAGSAAAAALAKEIGVDEVVLVVALVLLTVGLWPWLGRQALTIPGLVLLWMVLPARRPFVVHAEGTEKSSRRSE